MIMNNRYQIEGHTMTVATKPVVTVAGLRATIGSCLEQAHYGNPVFVTKHGRPYAALVTAQDGELIALAQQAIEAGVLSDMGELLDVAHQVAAT